MKTANAEIYQRLGKTVDRASKDGKYSVTIRVYFNRKYRYYSTGINLTPDEFDKVLHAKRRRGKKKNVYILLTAQLSKANKIIKDLTVFTFDAFEDAYFENRDIVNDVSYAFDKYIKELKADNRLGTANSYHDAKRSLETFKKGLTFADVTPKFLERYENWMTNGGKSISTVGMYLRALRAIFNKQNIDKSAYPFGKNKYAIPTSLNIKKALKPNEIAKIYQYKTEPNSTAEMARDYWMFLFLCNGMNVKDFCLLKWANIDGEMLRYTREKTKRTTKKPKQIEVSLKPETMEIIKKWGVRSLDNDSYIFPHFKKDMTPETKRKVYKQLNITINKYVKRIAKEVGINKPVTTYYARHSFATILKNNNTNIAMISDLLGHTSLSTTQSYLDGFEDEQIKKETDVLTAGLKEAN